MAPTKAQIRTSVLNLLGNHSQLPSATVDEILETENLEIIESWEWSRRFETVLINLIAPESTGTVSITNGSTTVTGVGTAFTAAMVGRFIRIAGRDSFHEITAFASATSLTIEATWVEATEPGAGYSIFQTIYPVAADAEKVVSLVSRRIPMLERSRDLFDRIDPSRKSSAADPEAWAHADRNGSDALRIETWPTPSVAHPIRARYQRIFALSTDTSVPLYRTDVLKWKAAEDGAMFLFSKTGTQTWARLAQTFHTRYLESFQQAKLDDLEKVTKLGKVRSEDRRLGISDDFAIDRDVDPF